MNKIFTTLGGLLLISFKLYALPNYYTFVYKGNIIPVPQILASSDGESHLNSCFVSEKDTIDGSYYVNIYFRESIPNSVEYRDFQFISRYNKNCIPDDSVSVLVVKKSSRDARQMITLIGFDHKKNNTHPLPILSFG